MSASVGIAPERKAELVALVKEQGYERRSEPFRLTSGGWSHDYIDGKYALSRGPALRRAAEAAQEVLGVEFCAVGGPTMGADALAHAVSILSGCGWFSVRKEAKGHGRQAWVEGSRLREGDAVVMVEDVVSTGASLLRAAGRLDELGVRVVAATALVDRSPKVLEAFDAAGIPWRPLLTWEDLQIEPL